MKDRDRIPYDFYVDNTKRTRYTKDDKILAAQAYTLWGTISKASKYSNVDKKTLSVWIERSDWFLELVEEIKLQRQEELDSRYTKVLHEVLEQIDDRILHGDYKLHARTKDVIRVPVGGKDLASIANTIFDKRQLLRGDATTIAAKRIENTKELEAKFLQIATDLQGKNVVQIDDKLIHTEIEETKHYD